MSTTMIRIIPMPNTTKGILLNASNTLDATTTMTLTPSVKKRKNGLEDAFLNVDGTNVAYICWYRDDTDPSYLHLCDIEVRNNYRQQGWVKKIAAMIEERENGTLYTSGSYTTLGYNRIAGLFPIHPSNKNSYHAEEFGDMTFVHDWDAPQYKEY